MTEEPDTANADELARIARELGTLVLRSRLCSDDIPNILYQLRDHNVILILAPTAQL